MKKVLFLFAALVSLSVASVSAQSRDKIVMPEYPGGTAALHKFLLSELNYPDEARKNREIGEVLIGFTVGMDGYVSGVRVLRSVSKSLDEEAVRVVKKMKYWKPGKRNGKPVPAEMSIPINFKTIVESGKYIDEGEFGETERILTE
ncbi:MAG: energy transducer TonB [Bacteroidaceae bacterium]|nr:energy transducer TonB [Bacteroidaceae bacterium]